MKATLNGKELTIVVDIDSGTPSKSSGKTLVVASSRGFQAVEGTDLKLNFTVTKPRA